MFPRFGYDALAAAGVADLLSACGTATPDLPQPGTAGQRFSYAMGAKLGESLRASGHALDRELVLRGMADGLAGKVALSDEALAAALAEGAQERSERQQALRADGAAAADAAGRAFLAENRARPGVVELPSGLQYEVLRAGSGPTPTLEDFVSCAYRATLLDGTVVDDTAPLGRPRTFAVTSVIDGFEEALLRMPAGSHWRIWVPHALAYGAQGAREKIPPNATLVFDAELLAIEPPPRR